VRWRDRAGTYRRDVGDGEHVEIVIAERVYRVPSRTAARVNAEMTETKRVVESTETEPVSGMAEVTMKRTKISAEVRAELEQRGADSVRAYLADLPGDRDASVLLLSGVKLRRGDMEDWLREKTASSDRWIKTGRTRPLWLPFSRFWRGSTR